MRCVWNQGKISLCQWSYEVFIFWYASRLKHNSPIGMLPIYFKDFRYPLIHTKTGFPLALENLKKWEKIFQPGKSQEILVESGKKVRGKYQKYWKSQRISWEQKSGNPAKINSSPWRNKICSIITKQIKQEAWRLYAELFFFFFCILDVWMSFIIFCECSTSMAFT